MSELETFEVWLSFTCTGQDQSIPTASVSFNPVPTTVADLKLAIQEKYQIPKCLQTITTDSNQKLSDSQLIRDLYLRSGDSLTVTYLDRAQVQTLGSFANDHLAPMLSKLEKAGEKKDLSTIAGENSRELNRLCSMYRRITYSQFLMPWDGGSSVVANRQFLIQEKVIDNTLKLCTIIHEVPTENKKHGLSTLETRCFGLIWNFGGSREARLHVVRRGGFLLMLRPLEAIAKEREKGKSLSSSMRHLFDCCVGCVSNYAEITQCQVLLAGNKAVMSSLLNFCLEDGTTNLFTKLLIGNCLFRISNNVETHKYLLEADTFEKTLQFFTKFHQSLSFVDQHLYICYALTVTLCRLLSFSLTQVPPQHLDRAVEVMKTFLTSTSREDVFSALEQVGRNWVTLSPFVDVFFAPIHNLSAVHSETSQEAQTVCMQVSLMALNVEMKRSGHTQLAVEQGLLDTLICLPWVLEEKWREEMHPVIELFRKYKDSCLPVPRLHTLATVCLAKERKLTINDLFKYS